MRKRFTDANNGYHNNYRNVIINIFNNKGIYKYICLQVLNLCVYRVFFLNSEEKFCCQIFCSSTLIVATLLVRIV